MVEILTLKSENYCGLSHLKTLFPCPGGLWQGDYFDFNRQEKTDVRLADFAQVPYVDIDHDYGRAPEGHTR